MFPVNGTTINAAIIVKVTNPDDFIIVTTLYVKNGLLVRTHGLPCYLLTIFYMLLLVDSGEYQLAFLLNPALISSMLAVADSGTRMPQKSTYFHPKTPAGLVINPLCGD